MDYLQDAKGNNSSMRLYGLIAIISIVVVVLVICFIAIFALFHLEIIDKVSAIILALMAVIGSLSTIVLYKGIQSFAENQKTTTEDLNVNDGGTINVNKD